MMLANFWLAPLVLAFQWPDAIGWLGQACFVLRMGVQWAASERAKRSIVPVSFWWISLAGTAFLLVYQIHRRDPVFLIGVLINAMLYARNLFLLRSEGRIAPKGRSPWLPLLLGLLAFACFAALGRDKLDLSEGGPWLVFGFVAQAVWSSRFIVQWILSERAGRSHLPAAFFWLSIAGSMGLFVYAIHRVDWVMMAAFALNPIPYARNLILMAREKRQPRSDDSARA